MIYDLSTEIFSDMEVYPGDPEVAIERTALIEDTGYNVTKLCLGTHTGTHVDVPLHYIKNGSGCSEISAEKCFGRAYVAKCRLLGGVVMLPENIPDCEILLIYTGWDKLYGTKQYFENVPPLSGDFLEEAKKRRLKAIGVDMPSVDRDGLLHHSLLISDILIYENLSGLQELTGLCGTFYGFPLKISSGDASPVRAIFRANP
ncbi:MAG: cyclase family protein [Clostridia bacterium]|nr:cyclase family protein [Clostridia bacterium]